MEQYYKLDKIRDLSDNDSDFIKTLVQTFLEEMPEDSRQLEIAFDSRDFLATYRAAHKIKPTIDLFGLGVLDLLIEVQDWGKNEEANKDVRNQLNTVLDAIKRASAEMRQDFNL